MREWQKTLEDEFFNRENERLRERLRDKQELQEVKDELREVTGIDDDAILDHLAELGVQVDTLAAIALVPLVEVAWADGKLDGPEKEALLRAAKDTGIDQRHPAYELFANWMIHRPEPRMLDAWSSYIHGLGAQLGPEKRAALKAKLMGRARKVAETAGGFLGLGNKVSPEEEKILGVLGRAFED
jgi:hypothetical protein